MIVVHPRFDRVWPYAVDHFVTLIRTAGDQVDLIRVPPGDTRLLSQVVPEPRGTERLISLGMPATLKCLGVFPALKEFVYEGPTGQPFPSKMRQVLNDMGISLYEHTTEGMWGESVAEFAIGLMICGLRRIPQLHSAITHLTADWKYEPAEDGDRRRGLQFGDDDRFVNGTVRGKRVRIVGAGNIGGRIARFASALGAEVAVWDPFASEPCFHLAGARKEWHLRCLVRDCDIFVPALPLTKDTYGIITSEYIDLLPRGCLVVMVTRASICDMQALRRRIVADELALAADVFDVEPLTKNDPLVGRHNVIHTPHIAGRTRDANEQYALAIVSQFR